MQICVVKLGGSLGCSPLLRDWLRELSTTGAGRAVIVPGGGPFADQVRDAQTNWTFDDKTAHHMALLAMEQFALMLCGLQQGLIPAADLPSIHKALQQGFTPVWMSANMILADTDVPQNWSVTSDSLAAWLAGRLQASKLILSNPRRREQLTRQSNAFNNRVSLMSIFWMRSAKPVTKYLFSI